MEQLHKRVPQWLNIIFVFKLKTYCAAQNFNIYLASAYMQRRVLTILKEVKLENSDFNGCCLYFHKITLANKQLARK